MTICLISSYEVHLDNFFCIDVQKSRSDNVWSDSISLFLHVLVTLLSSDGHIDYDSAHGVSGIGRSVCGWQLSAWLSPYIDHIHQVHHTLGKLYSSGLYIFVAIFWTTDFGSPIQGQNAYFHILLGPTYNFHKHKTTLKPPLHQEYLHFGYYVLFLCLVKCLLQQWYFYQLIQWRRSAAGNDYRHLQVVLFLTDSCKNHQLHGIRYDFIFCSNCTMHKLFCSTNSSISYRFPMFFTEEIPHDWDFWFRQYFERCLWFVLATAVVAKFIDALQVDISLL